MPMTLLLWCYDNGSCRTEWFNIIKRREEQQEWERLFEGRRAGKQTENGTQGISRPWTTRDSLIWKSDLPQKTQPNDTQTLPATLNKRVNADLQGALSSFFPHCLVVNGTLTDASQASHHIYCVINKGNLWQSWWYSLWGHCSLVQLSDWRSRPWQSFPPVPGVGWVHSLLLHMVQSAPHGDHLLHSLQPPSTEHTHAHRGHRISNPSILGQKHTKLKHLVKA